MIDKIFQLRNAMYSRTNLGFWIWFLFSVFLLFLFYTPFQQPILVDRAYFTYMAQTVCRGDSLYHATTYGYTPLPILVIGFFMRVGELFSISTITTSRLLGIFLYGLTSGHFFILSRHLFRSKNAAFISAFIWTGFGYLSILSCVDAEPKVFVAWFTILSMLFLFQKKPFWSGVMISFAIMSWHVAVVTALGFFLVWLLFNKEAIFKFIGGGIVGVLPVAFYLLFTNGWVPFYQQAVLRKIYVEGGDLAENPYKWVFRSIYPQFLTEFLFFVLAVVGLVVLCFFLKRSQTFFFKKEEAGSLLMITSGLWCIFNTLEFQGPPDTVPLLPFVTILSVVGLLVLWHRVGQKKYFLVAFFLFLIYNYGDSITLKTPFTFNAQKEIFSNIQNQYGNPLCIKSLEYYAVTNQRMPTKFMNLIAYEEYLIDLHKKGLDGIFEAIDRQGIHYIVKYRRGEVREPQYKRWRRQVVKWAGKKQDPSKGRMLYSKKIIKQKTNGKPIDSFILPMQEIFIGEKYVRFIHFDIYKVTR